MTTFRVHFLLFLSLFLVRRCVVCSSHQHAQVHSHPSTTHHSMVMRSSEKKWWASFTIDGLLFLSFCFTYFSLPLPHVGIAGYNNNDIPVSYCPPFKFQSQHIHSHHLHTHTRQFSQIYSHLLYSYHKPSPPSSHFFYTKIFFYFSIFYLS